MEQRAGGVKSLSAVMVCQLMQEGAAAPEYTQARRNGGRAAMHTETVCSTHLQPPVRASVTGKSVLARETSAKTSSKLGTLRKGQQVTLLELLRTQSGTVRARTDKGWVSAITPQGKQLLHAETDMSSLFQHARSTDGTKPEPEPEPELQSPEPHGRGGAGRAYHHGIAAHARRQLAPEVYRCENCAAFNGDSDVDDGEDEIELQPGGTASRRFRHTRSWIDGGGNSGNDVNVGSQCGTWSKSDAELRLSWQGRACHKGPAPTLFRIVDGGITLSGDYCRYDPVASAAAGKSTFTPQTRLYARVLPPPPPPPDNGSAGGGSTGKAAALMARFALKYKATHADALAQIRNGRKRGCWSWWIWPTNYKPGASATSRQWALSDAAAALFLQDTFLRGRWVTMMQAVAEQLEAGVPAHTLCGIDAPRAAATCALFGRVAGIAAAKSVVGGGAVGTEHLAEVTTVCSRVTQALAAGSKGRARSRLAAT
eukprot:SAG31_NODE_4311_length_3367_cov_1.694920_2_plen_483_part_00